MISRRYRKEYRDQAGLEERNIILPERVGGSKVQLLLGIKNTKLDPVLVKILPSGVAVYRSPFKDVYGSRMIFAGPHKSLTKDDKGMRVEMSNAVFFLRNQNPIQEEVAADPVEDLIDFFILPADAGKGSRRASNRSRDGSCRVCSRGITNRFRYGHCELDRFRSLSRIQTPDRPKYLENLEEELLIDMKPAELEKFRFQSRTQTPDKVGYLEKLEENVATYKKNY